MASLLLGITDHPILTYEGGQGHAKAFDGSIHPKTKEIAASRRAILASICETLAGFDGDRIDFYVMALGHGNMGAIVAQLRAAGVWPLRAKWKVSM